MTAPDYYRYSPPDDEEFTPDELRALLTHFRAIARQSEETRRQLAQHLQGHAPDEQKRRRPSVKKTMTPPGQAATFLHAAAAAAFCGKGSLHLWAAHQRLAGRLE